MYIPWTYSGLSQSSGYPTSLPTGEMVFEYKPPLRISGVATNLSGRKRLPENPFAQMIWIWLKIGKETQNFAYPAWQTMQFGRPIL